MKEQVWLAIASPAWASSTFSMYRALVVVVNVACILAGVLVIRRGALVLRRALRMRALRRGVHASRVLIGPGSRVRMTVQNDTSIPVRVGCSARVVGGLVDVRTLKAYAYDPRDPRVVVPIEIEAVHVLKSGEKTR